MTALPRLTVSRHALETVQELAHGGDERTLTARGLYLTSMEARRALAALGRDLNGGTGTRWTQTVHLAIAQGLIPVTRSADIALPYWQLDLLRAYACGLSLDMYAGIAPLPVNDARELNVLLLTRLVAKNEQHAVLRGHETGALRIDDPLEVTFGEALNT
ncbi:hypothetical protein [Streptomyces sp. NPDC015125]|uniref:hypothetical protein n=1 Tax=Streptomyces sp. NPDC015125 TaxID=3364938 RepID=UPI003701C5B9